LVLFSPIKPLEPKLERLNPFEGLKRIFSTTTLFELTKNLLEVAIVHGVPIVRREELARALYPVVEVGEEIPPKFYRAVAEVIAFVLSRRRRIAAEAVLKNPSLGRPPASKGTNPFLSPSHAPLREERSILLSRTGKRRATFRTY
jgi:flagellar biosynthesis protein FlhB